MKYVIIEDVLTREISDEVFVYIRKTGRLLSFSETGAFIWKLIEKGFDREMIISSLINEYITDEETAIIDFEKFILMLSSKGLIKNPSVQQKIS